MKTISQYAQTDIQQKVGVEQWEETQDGKLVREAVGRQWVETLDVFLGPDAPFDDYSGDTPLQYIQGGEFAGWHILISNADAVCFQDAPGTEQNNRKYTPVPYRRDDLSENNGANGAVVTSVKLGDPDGVIAGFMDETDGLVGQTVFCSLHWVENAVESERHIGISAPEITYEFIVKETSHDGTWAKVSLSTALPLERQWPPRKTSKAKCRWVFKGCECQYDGDAETCDRTIAACRALGNIVNFGAFPGCGVGGLAQ